MTYVPLQISCRIPLKTTDLVRLNIFGVIFIDDAVFERNSFLAVLSKSQNKVFSESFGIKMRSKLN